MRDVFFFEKRHFSCFYKILVAVPQSIFRHATRYGFGSTPHEASCARVFSVL